MLWTKSRLWAISSAPVVVCVPCSRRWQTSPLIWLFLQGFPLRLEGQSVSLCRLINVQTQRRHPLFYSAFYPFPLPFHGQLFPLLLWIIMIIICPKLKQCDTPVCQWKYLFGLTAKCLLCCEKNLICLHTTHSDVSKTRCDSNKQRLEQRFVSKILCRIIFQHSLPAQRHLSSEQGSVHVLERA